MSVYSRLLMCALLFATAQLLAQPATPPAVAPPVIDMKDPVAVAAAYGVALTQVDTTAALKLLDASPEERERLRQMFGEFAKGPDGMDGKTAVRQFLLVPVFGTGTYTAGKNAEINGDTATVSVVLTAVVDQKFVLKKQPDGTWRLDLNATAKATTGHPAFFLGGELAADAQATACLSNLKQLALAVLMFAQDHDETLPSADKWTDEIMPYLKNEAMLKCPAAKLACGYALNAKVAGKKLANIENPAATVLFIESSKGQRNQTDTIDKLAPQGRHNGANGFAYVDGHARLVPAGQDPGIAGEGGAFQAGQAQCLGHLKRLAAAALEYAKAHEDRLPAGKSWADDLQPYAKEDAIFHCLNEAGMPSGYALNSKVAGRRIADIQNIEETVLFFETTAGDRNACDALDSLDPVGRHHGGNCFAYVDGHARWVKVGNKP